MRYIIISLCFFVLINVHARAQQVTFTNTKELIDITNVHMTLSPDGKHLLTVRRKENAREHEYVLIRVSDGKELQTFDTGITFDDMFCIGVSKHVFSPDGSQILLMKQIRGGTLHTDLSFQIGDLKGNTKPLPAERRVSTAVFGHAGEVYYIDGFTKNNNPEKAELKVFENGQSKLLKALDTVISGLKVSPDGQRLGAFGIDMEKRQIFMWVYDLKENKEYKSSGVALDDYIKDGSPWVFWSMDSQSLYANGNVEQRGIRPFSILKYTPLKTAPKLTEADDKKLQALIQQIDADTVEDRDEAYHAIKNFGVSAVAILIKYKETHAENISLEALTALNRLIAALNQDVVEIQQHKNFLVLTEVSPGILAGFEMPDEDKKLQMFLINTHTDEARKWDTLEGRMLFERVGKYAILVNVERRLFVSEMQVKTAE